MFQGINISHTAGNPIIDVRHTKPSLVVDTANELRVNMTVFIEVETKLFAQYLEICL